MIIIIIIIIPDAPSMELLPECSPKNDPNGGKYSIDGASGFGTFGGGPVYDS